MDRGSWWGIVHGVAESDMTESDMTPIYCYGGCSGQCSMSSCISGLYPLEGSSQL